MRASPFSRRPRSRRPKLPAGSSWRERNRGAERKGRPWLLNPDGERESRLTRHRKPNPSISEERDDREEKRDRHGTEQQIRVRQRPAPLPGLARQNHEPTPLGVLPWQGDLFQPDSARHRAGANRSTANSPTPHSCTCHAESLFQRLQGLVEFVSRLREKACDFPGRFPSGLERPGPGANRSSGMLA